MTLDTVLATHPTATFTHPLLPLGGGLTLVDPTYAGVTLAIYDQLWAVVAPPTHTIDDIWAMVGSLCTEPGWVVAPKLRWTPAPKWAAATWYNTGAYGAAQGATSVLFSPTSTHPSSVAVDGVYCYTASVPTYTGAWWVAYGC
jgi:hypothetical protein